MISLCLDTYHFAQILKKILLCYRDKEDKHAVSYTHLDVYKRQVEDAVKYYTLVKEILGEEWCSPTLFRIGTSRLADSLLKAIEDE